MNISKAERLVRPVIDYFCDFTGETLEARVCLIDKNETGADRRQIFDDLKAKYEPFAEDCLSETVIGSEGIAIIVYPFNIYSTRDFTHSLLHECGHVYFRQVNSELSRSYQEGKLSDSEFMGYTLMDEFMAEALSNFADPEIAYFDEEQRRAQVVHLLYSAIPGINRELTKQAMDESTMFMRSCVYVLPAVLGRYAAMTLTDPTLVKLKNEEPDCDLGYQACGQNITAELRRILGILKAYLDSYSGSAFADNELLSNIGAAVIRIWKLRSAQKNR